jgi:hypothetical protein
MERVVVLYPGHQVVEGDYDGYGRVETEDGTHETHKGWPMIDPCLWHKACWEAKGRPYDLDRCSENAKDQGWFFEPGSHDLPEPRGPEEMTSPGILQEELAMVHEAMERVDGQGQRIFEELCPSLEGTERELEFWQETYNVALETLQRQRGYLQFLHRLWMWVIEHEGPKPEGGDES